MVIFPIFASCSVNFVCSVTGWLVSYPKAYVLRVVVRSILSVCFPICGIPSEHIVYFVSVCTVCQIPVCYSLYCILYARKWIFIDQKYWWLRVLLGQLWKSLKTASTNECFWQSCAGIPYWNFAPHLVCSDIFVMYSLYQMWGSVYGLLSCREVVDKF